MWATAIKIDNDEINLSYNLYTDENLNDIYQAKWNSFKYIKKRKILIWNEITFQKRKICWGIKYVD